MEETVKEIARNLAGFLISQDMNVEDMDVTEIIECIRKEKEES